MQTNPYQQYKQSSITTMTPMEIVIKLFVEAEREISRGIHFIGEKDYAGANGAIIRAQRFIQTLRSSLDMNYAIADNLDALYEYIGRELVQANLRKDTTMLETLLSMLTELREAFAQAVRTQRH